MSPESAAEDAGRAEQAAAEAEVDIHRSARQAAREAEEAAAVVARPVPEPELEPAPLPSEPAHRGRVAVTRDRLAVGLMVLSALFLVGSALLALGALIAALDPGRSGVVRAIGGVCDVLVGPFAGVFDFSGDEAAMKNDLFDRGLASVVFLLAGFALHALQQRRED